MAMDDYAKAQKQGQRSYQKNLMQGKYPYLQVLEEILSHTEVVSEQKIGLVQIPIDLIVGTFAAGRRTAFAPNFMPLLESETEFAAKWSKLCDAHIEEGIRDPIEAYEFMNRYYVVEGNKRVSVLKYFEAATIPGVVTRIIPRRTDAPENRVYFEYLEFNKRTGIDFLLFSQPGSYRRLMEELKKGPQDTFSEQELLDLRSAQVRFAKAYKEKGGEKLGTPSDDAMLTYMEMYSYQELCQKMPAELKEDIAKIWDEIELSGKSQPTEIVTEPVDAPKKTFIERLIPIAPKVLKIAFIHDKDKETSGWTYGHELGRMYLEDQMKGEVETMCINNVSVGSSLEQALETAFQAKCDIIFTTTPQFLDISLKAAVKHPQVKILNCSVNPTHRNVRTYYARLYEAKFLAGIIAGSMSVSGKIGYIADYPICGMIANINAFAMGAKMVNPRAVVYLDWKSVRPIKDIISDFREQEIYLVSCQELASTMMDSREYGLINIEKEEPENIAMAIWHWGVLYKRLIQSVKDGSWKAEDADGLAVNYWWGMSADVIDIICSDKVPEATKRLVWLLKQNICSGVFHPFSGPIRSQKGWIKKEDKDRLTSEEIISMNWLAENVVGVLPEWEWLDEEAKAVVSVQGIDDEEEKVPEI